MKVACNTQSHLLWWNTDSDDPPHSHPIDLKENHFIVRPSFNHDGTQLAAANGTKLNVLDTKSGKLIVSKKETGQAMGRVCYSPDGSFIVGLCLDGICIWETVNYERTGLLTGHDGELLAMALGLEGQQVASSSADSIKIRDMRTKHEVAHIPVSSKVYAMDFSPDGTRLAAGCSDGTLRLFDLRTYEEVIVLSGHQDYVIGLAFSPDGKSIVTASGDKTVRVWDADWDAYSDAAGTEAALAKNWYSRVVPLRLLSLGVTAVWMTKHWFFPRSSAKPCEQHHLRLSHDVTAR